MMKLIFSALALQLLAVAALPQESHNGPDSVSAASTSISSSASGNASTTEAPATLTGLFTVPSAGVYPVTSVSGYAVIAGHTLIPGSAGALVGGVEVTEASGGFVANGQTVALQTYSATSLSIAPSSSSVASTTSSAPGPAGQSPAASTLSKSSGMAVATSAPMAGAALLGGVMGMMLL